MITTSHTTLSVIPQSTENTPVTTFPDGTTLSRIFDTNWDFSGQEQGRVGKLPIVPFKHVDAAYRRDIQSTLVVFMEDYRKRKKRNATSNQVQHWKNGLVYVRNALGTSDWASISDDIVYRRFKKAIKKQVKAAGWKKSTITKMLTAINLLRISNLCARIPDQTEYLSWIIREREQHIAMPIGMYQPLLAWAISIVEKYHPHRITITETQRQVYEITSEEQARTDVEPKSLKNRVSTRIRTIQHSIPNFKPSRKGTDVLKILRASSIVALAFSGVRIGELLSMNKYSYKEVGNNGIPVLNGEETKRLGQVVQETWQTHKVVKDALELAYDATQFLRDIYKARNDQHYKDGEISLEKHKLYERQISSAFLNVAPAQAKKSYCQSNLPKVFNEFIKRSGIVASQADVDEFNLLNPSREGQLKLGETLPKLTPHDFRRSFAVFFKRYGFGSSATIKFQYKHRNINMSDYYSNNAHLQVMHDLLLDNELLNLMNEEGIHMGVDIFDEIYNESEHLGGAGGNRIAKDKFERLSSGEQVYMTRTEIERLVRNGTLSVVKLPTGGYCTNATCSRVCGIGEFATEIKPCEHQVITDNQARVILRQNKRIIKAFREMNTGDPMMNSILIGQKQKIKRNEQLIKDFNLSFEPFNDKIKGIIETVGV